jgi:hypothetical protein
MAGDETPQAVVASWQTSSCGTGESYYRTADGRVWRTVSTTPTLTGAMYGTTDGRTHSPKRG